MATWFTMLERKKDRKAHEHRVQIKEVRARATQENQAAFDANEVERERDAMEEEANGLYDAGSKLEPERAHQQMVTQRRQTTAPQHEMSTTPQHPATSTTSRRARRTEQRHRASTTNTTIASSITPNATDAAPTPDNSNISSMSLSDYSKTYYKNNKAPIDRTETDWFALRAQGLDPRKHRKRSFSWSSSEDEKPQVENKRSKVKPLVPSAEKQVPVETPPAPPATMTADNQLAKCRSIQQSLRKTISSSTQPAPTAPTAAYVPSPSVTYKARKLLRGSSSTDTQHGFGRSVPNLGLSASIRHRSVQSMGGMNKSQNGYLAYQAHESRFFPRNLFGQGGDAVQAWRHNMGLSSPASPRPASARPLALSSPTLMQQIFDPSAGFTQELQYNDNQTGSSFEAFAASATMHHGGTAADYAHADVEQYQAGRQSCIDEVYDESQEKEHEPDQNGHVNRTSSSFGHDQQPAQNGVQYDQGKRLKHEEHTEDKKFDEERAGEVEGEGYNEEEIEFEEEQDEDEESDESEDQAEVHHQPYSPWQAPQQASKFGPQQVKPGGTQDDAIELSD